jgi:RNA polymerase sigma factor (sigma-70 family)
MDEKTFEALYEEHAEALYGFLAYRTGNHALAEDLLADTFERALKARRRFDVRKGAAKTWLYSIALNLWRDTVRRNATEQKALEALSSRANGNGHSGQEQVEARQIIMAGLDTLGDDEREALALRYGADLSLAEIAKVLRKPRSTVEGRIYRGLKHLRSELVGQDQPQAEAQAASGS